MLQFLAGHFVNPRIGMKRKTLKGLAVFRAHLRHRQGLARHHCQRPLQIVSTQQDVAEQGRERWVGASKRVIGVVAIAAGLLQLLILVADGTEVSLPIHLARLQGEVLATSGWVGTTSGWLYGLVAKGDLSAALVRAPDAAPDFARAGGAADAWSVALQWSSVRGKVVGVTAPQP